PNGGIHTESHPVRSVLASHPFARRAVVRGPVALVDAMRVALDAIRVSVRVTTGVEPDRRQVGTTLGSIGLTVLVLFVAGPGVAVLLAGAVSSVVPRRPLAAGALWRVLLFPLVAALAYEMMRLAAREHGEVWARIVVWPGRLAQRLTTREPSDAQLDVARAAL